MQRFEITVNTADGPVSYGGLFRGSCDAIGFTLDTFPEARSITVMALRGAA